MLTKRKLGRGKVRVTFTMPPLEGVKQLALVGDFNNWSITQNPLTKGADGNWSTALTLEAGQTYRFRYFADGQNWHNDWAADAYAPNEHGTDNSVVSTYEEALPTAKKNGSRKKVAA